LEEVKQLLRVVVPSFQKVMVRDPTITQDICKLSADATNIGEDHDIN
jgi:hypothetical protein